MSRSHKLHINNQEATHDCTSCQICYAVCPTDAISIRLNDEGFYRPYVDEEICIGCQKCTRYCYKFDTSVDSSDLGSLAESLHYASITQDRKLLQNTSSGGVASEVADYLLSKKYRIVGVSYSGDTDEAMRTIAKTEEEAKSFRGSKYIHANNSSALKEIVTRAKREGAKYAFFGLPCEVYALNRFAEDKGIRDQFVLIELYCHGVPSNHLWLKYINEVKDKYPSAKYNDVNFRSKNNSDWGRYQIEIKGESGQSVYLSDNNDHFFELFFSNQILNKSCIDCKLRGNLSYGDIRLGDFWGHRYLFNTQGVSLVSTNTDKGDQIIKTLSQLKITLTECMVEEFAPYQSLYNIYPANETVRDRMIQMLKEDKVSLKETVVYYHKSSSLKKKVFRQIKKGISILPFRVQQTFKYLYYHLK